MKVMKLLIQGLMSQPCDKHIETSEEELPDFFLPACEVRSKEKSGFTSVCCLRRLAMFLYHHWGAKENRSNLSALVISQLFLEPCCVPEPHDNADL